MSRLVLDWLKRDPRAVDQIELAGRSLPIVIRHLTHARRLTLRLSPNGDEVRVSMPRWGRTAEALAFVRARAGWLERQIAVLPKAASPSGGGLLAYRGNMLMIAHAAEGARRVRIMDDAIVLGGPAETLAPRLRRWLTAEARRLLADDLACYCAAAGLPVPKLALSNAQRRWGSCSARGAVRINWRLIMAPDAVRRSVVAHEVAHLVHFDHSAKFHALLGELFEGDIAEANRWLRREGRGLYAVFG